MPAADLDSVTTVWSALMAEVMIGIDPHKNSHTAVAIGSAEEPLGELQVQACPSQAETLLAWAAAWPERTWAVEGAAGLGHLLAQQLVAAGEQVLDVPPKLAARVRLLQAGDTGKNDPNDAFSVAVAALRSPAKRPVLAEDRAAVLKVWANGTATWPARATRPPAGCTPCSATWSPAVTRGRSPRARPPASSSGSPHQALWPGPAASSPPSSWPTSAAWTPSCATPRGSWPRRSKPPAPA